MVHNKKKKRKCDLEHPKTYMKSNGVPFTNAVFRLRSV